MTYKLRINCLNTHLHQRVQHVHSRMRHTIVIPFQRLDHLDPEIFSHSATHEENTRRVNDFDKGIFRSFHWNVSTINSDSRIFSGKSTWKDSAVSRFDVQIFFNYSKISNVCLNTIVINGPLTWVTEWKPGIRLWTPPDVAAPGTDPPVLGYWSYSGRLAGPEAMPAFRWSTFLCSQQTGPEIVDFQIFQEFTSSMRTIFIFFTVFQFHTVLEALNFVLNSDFLWFSSSKIVHIQIFRGFQSSRTVDNRIFHKFRSSMFVDIWIFHGSPH